MIPGIDVRTPCVQPLDTMTTKRRPRSVELSAVSEAAFGPLWVSQVARLTGMETRTVQRMREAGAAGREHPRAGECLVKITASLSLLLRRYKALCPREDLREIEKRYVRKG